MSASVKLEIAFSKKKLTVLWIISILFLLAGLWLIFKNPETNTIVFDNPVFQAFTGYGSLLLGVVGIYFFSKQIFSKQSALILSEKGIIENTTVFKHGLIPWSDIAAIEECAIRTAVSKQLFIVLKLNNPEKYISAAASHFKRKLLKSNFKQYNSPVIITTNEINMQYDELLQVVKEYFEKYNAA